jgi:hypothetical protein
MNRIVLKLNFLPNNGLKLDLFHLDRRFLSNQSSFVSFYDSDYEFMIYSRKKLMITPNTLRLPDAENYKDSQSVTYNFKTEKERYFYLKSLNKCLHEWNNRYSDFVGQKDYNKRNKNLIMSGEFWVI